ncbi:MAG: ferritin-like domain-containing protein [Halothiobacillaceae bacterium]
MIESIHQAARSILMTPEPREKARRSKALYDQACTGFCCEDERVTPIEAVPDPGRPAKPDLVLPRDLARRDMRSQAGRVVLAHALAHIEFNAINIALDAVYRFRGMPKQYYLDWLQVAAEEGAHFVLLADYLADHGAGYGDFPAHGGLWEMVRRTDDDVLVRMALVPRVFEARGLDVTPGMQRKLAAAGDDRLVAILDVIYREEIGHVEIGTRWFRHACAERGVPPRETFRDLLRAYMSGRIRGPYDELGRMEAGFTAEEMEDLREMERETLARLESEGASPR